MNRTVTVLGVAFLAFCRPSAAQQNTTIQLPTFNMTTVQTTVSVPDRGSISLGGVNRAAEGSVTRGVPLLSNIPGLNRLFKNRGIGRDFSSSNMSLDARIIIPEEEELLQTGLNAETLSRMGEWSPYAPAYARNPAGRPPMSMDPQTAQKAAFLAANVARHRPPEPASASEPAAAGPAAESPSVAEIRRENQRAAAVREAEAREFFAQGQRAEAEGKAGVARVYYQMAGRRAQGDLQLAIASRMAALESAQDAPQVAGR